MSEPSADAPAGEHAENVTCKFPTGCGNPREPKADPSAPGPASEYCARPDHNPGTAWRAKRALQNKAKRGAGGAAAVEEPETDKPVTDAAAEAVNVRELVITTVDELRHALERYVGLLQTASDPEAAEAQVLAVESEANTRIASAEARADQERSAKVAAQSAKVAAEEETVAANQAAEQMEAELEEARARFQAEVERINGEAKARAEAAEAAAEGARAEAKRLVAEAKALTETHVNAAREAATNEINAMRRRTEAEVKEAHHLAGLAKNEADRRDAEMTRTLEQGQAAAAAQVEEANGRAAAAETRATEAEENGRQAIRNADAMVEATKTAAETVRAGLAAELDRTNTWLKEQNVRAKEQDARVDSLHRELNEAKELLRAAAERERALETRAQEAEAALENSK
ncbi:hypothetical protein ACIBAC_00025 [Streptomyces sp. NPDC051362]|uniref:hypothetical protein n=1 Tax=Streptomyces sp. NPDC051362 TaxID=3365651 RepID=UPI00378F31C1